MNDKLTIAPINPSEDRNNICILISVDNIPSLAISLSYDLENYIGLSL